MAIKDLLPWNRSSEKQEIIPAEGKGSRELDVFDETWNQWMNDFWRDPFGTTFPREVSSKLGSFSPAFDISESEKEFVVSAEIPGLDAKDFQIQVEGSTLVMSGEKKMEKKEKDHAYTRIGRVYGSFHQRIPLPMDQINQDNISARYDKGILQVTLPKAKNVMAKSKRIPIQSA